MRCANLVVVPALVAICLEGTNAVAHTGEFDVNTEPLRYVGSNSVEIETQENVSVRAYNYMIGELFVAEAGYGVREVALTTQTEPQESDSVFNIKENIEYQEGESYPESVIKATPTLYNKPNVTDRHFCDSLIYTSGSVSGVRLPAVMNSNQHQFTVGFNASMKKARERNEYSANLDYRFNIGDGMEINCNWTPIKWDGQKSGTANIGVGFRYNLLKNDSNALSWGIGISLPTGPPSGFSDIGIEGGTGFSYSYYLPDKWALTGNLSVNSNNDTPTHRAYMSLGYGLQVGKSLDDNNYMALSFYGDSRDSLTNHVSKPNLELYWSHKFNEEQSMSLGLKRSLSGTGDALGISASYSLTF